MRYTRYTYAAGERDPACVTHVTHARQVSVTSSKIDKLAAPIVLSDGACFGETSLVARVRREATVVAIEDCLMLVLNAHDLDDLEIDLFEMRLHVISQILAKVLPPSRNGRNGRNGRHLAHPRQDAAAVT